jgi:hypothetical protein
VTFPKQILFLVILVLLGSACGQKSQVTPNVKPKKTAEAYGDGEHIYRTVVMPLSDNLIEDYESPIEKINFIAGGFARMFMDLGAGIGFGRAQLTMFQPVPEIPKDFIRGASLKRVFFYIEPTSGKRRKNLLQRVFRGKTDVDYNFLNRLAVKISTHQVENVRTWVPHFETRSIRGSEYTPLQSIFEREEVHPPVKDPEALEELVIVKYSKKSREKFLRNNEFGSIFIMDTKEPIKIKRHLEKHPKLKSYIKRIHVLLGKAPRPSEVLKAKPVPGTLLVELHKDPVADEGFKVIISEEAEDLQNIGVKLVEQCTLNTCLDFQLPDTDILPLMTKSNAVKIDAFMDARKVPESFQLKGFIEFEVKFRLGF